MRALFVMDPLSTIKVDKDSSYALMLEWQARGGEVLHCLSRHLRLEDGVLAATASRLRVGPKPHMADVLETVDISSRDLDVIWKRTDPPFDMSYIFATYLLDAAAPGCQVVNSPSGLRDANEKMVILRFADIVVPSLVSNDGKAIKRFVQERGRAVIKPWDGNGGRGIFVLDADDKNLRSMIETSTMQGAEHAIVQEYIPAIAQGDKRIILIDGEPRGAFLRVPPADDHRGNMSAGATVEPCEMTDRDRHICATIAPFLRDNGLLFTGIDVIGDWLTEVNVTSPTGLQEIKKLYGTDLAAELVDAVLAKGA
jgi:glutathione synthase